MSSKVIAGAIGGIMKEITISGSTVADVKRALGLEGNYTATVNCDTAEMSDSVSDGDMIAFAESVKGGN